MPNAHATPCVPARRQHGFSLLEVLISALIFAIGLLGLAALQARTLAAANSSYERAAAAIYANSILDAMRAAVMSAEPAGRAAQAQAYVRPDWICAPPNGGTLASNDLRDWITEMRANLHPSACGRVTAIDANTFTYRVEVCWNDSAGGENTDNGNCLGGDPATLVTLESRL